MSFILYVLWAPINSLAGILKCFGQETGLYKVLYNPISITAANDTTSHSQGATIYTKLNKVNWSNKSMLFLKKLEEHNCISLSVDKLARMCACEFLDMRACVFVVTIPSFIWCNTSIVFPLKTVIKVSQAIPHCAQNHDSVFTKTVHFNFCIVTELK